VKTTTGESYLLVIFGDDVVGFTITRIDQNREQEQVRIIFSVQMCQKLWLVGQ
jgi:hypothetical protein